MKGTDFIKPPGQCAAIAVKLVPRHGKGLAGPLLRAQFAGLACHSSLLLIRTVPNFVIARSPSDEAIQLSSCAGSTRASITLRKSLSKKMDCRVKPGNDDVFRFA